MSNKKTDLAPKQSTASEVLQKRHFFHRVSQRCMVFETFDSIGVKIENVLELSETPMYPNDIFLNDVKIALEGLLARVEELSQVETKGHSPVGQIVK